MLTVEADTSNIDKYIGSVEGIISAIDSQQFKGNFMNAVTSIIEENFMIDAVASRDQIKHVFEWPDDMGGQVSMEPLFKMVRTGEGETKIVSYEFLPSHKYVPLPTTYGISPEILDKLSRHVFEMKAYVMENEDSVTIIPHHKLLFIPDATNPNGYFMTQGSTQINPGGTESTGKFAKFFEEWMVSRAQQVITEICKKEAEVIASTGQKIIRDSAGRFATGTKMSYSYVVEAKTKAEAQMIITSKEAINV